MKYAILTICLFNYFYFSYQITTNFSFPLKAKKDQCLSEYFPDNTLVVVDITSSRPKIDFNILNPSGKEIASLLKDSNFKTSFTTLEGGYYSICCKNNNHKEKKDKSVPDESTAKIDFTIRHGITAKDYSTLNKMKDLKPIDVNLEKLETKIKEILHLFHYSESHEKVIGYIFDKVKSTIISYSLVLIVIILIVAFCESYYLKTFVNRRKIV